MVRILAAAALVVGYYHFGKRALFAVSKNFAARLRLARKYPIHHLENSVELIVVGFSHLALCVVLAFALGFDGAALGLTTSRNLAALLSLGVPLGIGEMVLSALLCRAVVETLLVVAPANAPSGLQGWLTVSRGGWMRHYVKTVAILPLPITLVLTALNVAAEEFVFRALMLNHFKSVGPLPAILLSTLLFSLMQTFLMPSWRNALFPAIGALVMGLVHGALFMLVPSLLPLVVAHLVFFTFAMI